jgi:Mg2+-importing ATPase
MFSMAGAALFLPFLPLLPAQILLNNLLYDVSEIPIPLDRADAAETARPQKWDMALVRNFMWVLGPVSSLFDFLTFYVLLAFLNAHEALFRTGWFVESLATQVLVIFVIRTRSSPFASRPHPALAAVACAVLAVAVALPFTPLAAPLGFVAPPPLLFAVLAGLVAAYLVLAEIVKRAFYRLSRTS